MEFQFQNFETRKYGYIRGRNILNNLLSKENFNDWGVNSVQIVSGHIAINFQQSKSICLFDATVSGHQLNETVSNSLQNLICSKQLLQSPLSPATQSLPILACSFDSKVIKFGFEKYIVQPSTNSTNNSNKLNSSQINNKTTTTTSNDNNTLRFFVFESDGYLHIWEWSNTTFKWNYIVKIYLFISNREITQTIPYSTIENLQITNAAVFGSSQGMSISWLTNKSPISVNCRLLNFNNINNTSSSTSTLSSSSSSSIDQLFNKQTFTTNKDKVIEEIYPSSLIITGLETYEMKKDWENSINSSNDTKIISTKLGLWFITSSFILFWSFRNKIWNILYFKDNNSNNHNSNGLVKNNSNNNLKLLNNDCSIHLTTNNSENSNNIDSNNNIDNSNNKSNNSGDKNLEIYDSILDCLSFCKNPLSQDLVILESSGKLFTCEPWEKEKLKIKLIAVLDLKDIDKNKQVRLLRHQNAFVILNEKYAHFYDTKCGEILNKIKLPVELSSSSKNQSIWENGTAGIVWGCGFWSQSDGIWEIKSTVTPNKFIELLSTHKQQNDNIIGGCAASTCKECDLKNLESKYLLDLALNEKDEETKIKICKSLLPRLENPALVIALLSDLQSYQSCKFIMQELKVFLDNYEYFNNLRQQDNNGSVNSISTLKDDDERSKIKNSFIYQTPLNEKMIPLLKEYFNLQSSAIDPTSTSSSIGINGNSVFSQDDNEIWVYNQINKDNQDRIIPDLSKLQDSMVLDLSYEQVEYFKKNQSKLLLEKLENALQLSQIDFSLINDEMVSYPIVNSILLHTEENIKVKDDKQLKQQQQQQQQQQLNNTNNSNINNNLDNNNLNNNNNNNINNSNTNNSNNTIITFTGNNGIVYSLKYPVFEIMCQLYYYNKPKNIIPFVCLVHNSSINKQLIESEYNSISGNSNNSNKSNNQEKDHFFRALMALPVSLPQLSPIQNDQIDSRFKLLISIGHKPNALRFLLNANQWERAIDLFKTTHNETESYVLYEILLSFCIEKKDNSKLKQCWEIIPKNFGVFNLLSLLKVNNNNNNINNNNNSNNNSNNNNNNNSNTNNNSNNNSNNNNVHNPNIISLSSNEDLTIDMFRSQLLKMLNKQ